MMANLPGRSFSAIRSRLLLEKQNVDIDLGNLADVSQLGDPSTNETGSSENANGKDRD